MRRRFVWIQGAPPASEGLFLLYDGPEGYYVQRVGGDPQLAAPFFDDDNPNGIFPNVLTAISGSDWRLSASGLKADFVTSNSLFYGPSGLVLSVSKDTTIGREGNSGVFQTSLIQNSSLGIFQEFWDTAAGASGSGANTYPDFPPKFVLPNVTVASGSTDYRPNDALSWAVAPSQLIDSAGTTYPITSGSPSPWPRRQTSGSGGKEGRVGNFVNLTLFVHDLSTGPDTITTTPYLYDSGAGTATAGTPFATPYTHPGAGWTLRQVSYYPPT